MKKKLAALLLGMLILLSACSPGNILTAKPDDSNSEPQPGAPQDDSSVQADNTQPDDTQQGDTESGQDTQQDELTTSGGQQQAPITNPLLDPDRKANTQVKSSIDASGLIKDVTQADLADKTINLFVTDKPAFSYKDDDGKTVDEFGWLDSLKDSYKLNIKYRKVNSSGIMTYQNIAQKAGIALDLVQVSASDFLTGLTVCKSIDDRINTDVIESMDGVSSRVFSLSENRLLSPKGVGLALWYNKGLLSNSQLNELYTAGAWTFSAFEQLYSKVYANGQYLYETSSWLAWGAASGILPVAYAENEVVNNLDKGALKAAFNNLLNLNAMQNFVNTTDSSFLQGKVAMSYGAAPVNTTNIDIGWMPIPKASADGMYVLSFNGTSFGLPKNQSNPDNTQVALQFAHMWCNRYTESFADSVLFDTKLSADDYKEYYTAVETLGQFISGDQEIASIFNTKSKFNESLYNKEYNFEVELQAASQLLDIHLNRLNNQL